MGGREEQAASAQALTVMAAVLMVLVPAALRVIGEADHGMVWFGIMMAVNLQIAFISPPVGFSLFYMQSVAPKDQVTTADIHSSAIPFVVIQLVILLIVSLFPELSKFLVRLT